MAMEMASGMALGMIVAVAVIVTMIFSRSLVTAMVMSRARATALILVTIIKRCLEIPKDEDLPPKIFVKDAP